MSQAELQKLLYSALASGSDTTDAPANETAANQALPSSTSVMAAAKPRDVVTRFDFRAHSPRHAR